MLWLSGFAAFLFGLFINECVVKPRNEARIRFAEDEEEEEAAAAAEEEEEEELEMRRAGRGRINVGGVATVATTTTTAAAADVTTALATNTNYEERRNLRGRWQREHVCSDNRCILAIYPRTCL